MPIWSEILGEIEEGMADGNPPAFDIVRRKYLVKLHDYTQRPVILYASGWLQKEAPEASLSIGDDDIQGLMEVTSGLGSGPALDLILHSPGGSAESAEAIVSYLRSRFDYIRAIVPNLAMSAATMICCAADEIVLGKHSFLGPTDPQILLDTEIGLRTASAQAILDQFDRALRDTSDQSKIAAWMPLLSKYPPGLLEVCEKSLQLSQDLVKSWLQNHMMKGHSDSAAMAESAAKWFSDHQTFKSHGRHISRDELKKHSLNITDLESDTMLQDLVLSVFHAATHTFAGTEAAKIVENHTGRAFIKAHRFLTS